MLEIPLAPIAEKSRAMGRGNSNRNPKEVGPKGRGARLRGVDCTTRFTSANENHQHTEAFGVMMETGKRKAGGDQIRKGSTSVTVFPFSTRRKWGEGCRCAAARRVRNERGAYSVKASNAVQKFLTHHSSSPPFPPIRDSSPSWSSPCCRVIPAAGPPLG